MRYLLVLLVLTTALAYGCSGGDDGGTPAAIPTFTGAELVPESVVEEGDSFFGTWRTSEDVPAVQEYFEQELPTGGYRVVETRPIEDGVVIVVEESEDAATGGTIVVRRDGDSTRIVETIGRDDEGDEDEDEDDDGGGSGEVTEGELPPGFPADVPLPEDAEVISGSAPRVGDTQYYLAEFTATQSPAELIAYFNSALPAEGWEAGASSEDPGALVLNYSRGNDRVTVTGGAAGDGTNAAITVVLRD